MNASPFAQWAEHLLDGGYSPVPLRPGMKRPLEKMLSGRGWDSVRETALTPAEIGGLTRKHPGLGLGVAGGFNGLVPVDVDTVNPRIVYATISALPELTVNKVGRRGFTAFFRDPTGSIPGLKFKKPLGGGKFDMLVEILATGQTVLPPTIHPDTQKSYRWITLKTLFNLEVNRLPIITPAHIARLKEALSPWLPAERPQEPSLCHSGPVPPVSGNRMQAYANAILANEMRALASMAPNSGRNRRLFDASCKLGKFVFHDVIARHEVEEALLGACRENGLWNDADCGPKGCAATLRSGLNKSRNDPPPMLPEPRQEGRLRRAR
jgi:hypothetical protein